MERIYFKTKSGLKRKGLIQKENEKFLYLGSSLQTAHRIKKEDIEVLKIERVEK